MRLWMRWPAWLCLSLLLWTVTVESTHNHSSQSENASCAICLAAHTASPAVRSIPTSPVLAAVGLVREEDVIAKAQFDFSEAGIRGPPVL